MRRDANIALVGIKEEGVKIFVLKRGSSEQQMSVCGGALEILRVPLGLQKMLGRNASWSECQKQGIAPFIFIPSTFLQQPALLL